MKATAEKITPLFTFISTGDKCAMYTLRIMNEYRGSYQGESYCFVDSEYVKNLSTEKSKAEAAAAEISEMWNIKFKGNADFELNEIRRQQELESEYKIAERNRIIAEREAAAVEEYNAAMNAGVLLVGKHTGKTVAEAMEVDPGYVFWLAKQASFESKNIYSVGANLCAKYIEENNLSGRGYIGSVGEEITIDLVVSRVTSFESYYGVSYVVNCFDSEYRAVSIFTSSKKLIFLEAGEKVTVKALVSEHSEFRGTQTTTLKKPKVVKN